MARQAGQQSMSSAAQKAEAGQAGQQARHVVQHRQQLKTTHVRLCVSLVSSFEEADCEHPDDLSGGRDGHAGDVAQACSARCNTGAGICVRACLRCKVQEIMCVMHVCMYGCVRQSGEELLPACWPSLCTPLPTCVRVEEVPVHRGHHA